MFSCQEQYSFCTPLQYLLVNNEFFSSKDEKPFNLVTDLMEDAICKLSQRGCDYSYSHKSRVLNHSRLREIRKIELRELYTEDPLVLRTRSVNGSYYIVNARVNGYSLVSKETYRRDFRRFRLNHLKAGDLSELL